jgi:hypothetical protein
MAAAQAPREPPGGKGDAPRGRKPFLLRLPPDLMEELRGWSEAELRSLNGHIEYLLRAAVRRRRGERGEDS